MNIFPNDQIRIVTDEKILRQVSKQTSFKEALDLKLFDRLREATEKAWTGGVGLAAIQLGVPLRFAFYKDPNMRSETSRYLINPNILHAKNLVPHMQEGCLSLPNQRFTAWRFQEIVYEKLVNGKMETHTARGLEAVIIQHEVDHMNGILCCDRTMRPEMPERNNPCPCASGKKFKKCCIEKGVPYA